MFGKRPSELTPEDIRRVVDEQVPENAEIELKATFPCKKGNDPWIDGDGRIGDYARNELIEEVIAFAVKPVGQLRREMISRALRAFRTQFSNSLNCC